MVNRKDKYVFDDKKHIHLLNDKPLCGVTSVLGVISKPALIQWSANMACSYVKENLHSLDDLEEVLSKAKTAHRAKKEKAGDWGTKVHKAVEEWIKLKLEPESLDNEQQSVFEQFKQWSVDNKVEFIESEKHIWSSEHWIGGIVDLILTIDGKKYIGDIKTSSGIYNEAFFQMGAYHLCLESMGEAQDIQGYVVINLKKDGTIDFKKTENMEINKDAFKSALSLYKIINSLE